MLYYALNPQFLQLIFHRKKQLYAAALELPLNSKPTNMFDALTYNRFSLEIQLSIWKLPINRINFLLLK